MSMNSEGDVFITEDGIRRPVSTVRNIPLKMKMPLLCPL